VVAVVCVRVTIVVVVAVVIVRVAIAMVVSIARMAMVDYLVTIAVGWIRVSCWLRVSFRYGVSCWLRVSFRHGVS